MNGQFVGKSRIQLVMEAIERLHELKDKVRNFVTYYDTDNAVFGLYGGQVPQELESGFLSIENTYENLEEALDHMNRTDMAIQILNREKNGRVYRIGTLKPLSECNIDENTVVNIKTLKEI